MPYVLKGSDLEDRLDRTLDSYLAGMHNSNFLFDGYTLNGVTALGNDIYVLDVSADAGSQMPAGYVKVHRDMKVYIKYFPRTDEAVCLLGGGLQYGRERCHWITVLQTEPWPSCLPLSGPGR